MIHDHFMNKWTTSYEFLMSDFSSMFSEYKTWKMQLSTLLGDAEVSKFQNKLSSINVTGLDNFKLGVDVFFNLAESKVD